MGSEIFATSRERALQILRRAPALHLASAAPDGSPLGGAVDFVVHDGAVRIDAPGLAHAGRRAVLSAERAVAVLPDGSSTWVERVRLRGVLEAEPPYVRMPLAALEGESRVGQELEPQARRAVLERLWRRGLPGDPAAIERARDARPDTPTPEFLSGPAGTTLVCALDERAVDAAVELLADEYWNAGVPRDVIAAALLGSEAWVGARDAEGRLVANARAIGDGAKVAWIFDVTVHREWRGRGLGHAVMRLLLDHPVVRRVRRVLLDTRDAQRLYEGFGFVDRAALPRAYPSTQLILKRA